MTSPRRVFTLQQRAHGWSWYASDGTREPMHGIEKFESAEDARWHAACDSSVFCYYQDQNGGAWLAEKQAGQ